MAWVTVPRDFYHECHYGDANAAANTHFEEGHQCSICDFTLSHFVEATEAGAAVAVVQYGVFSDGVLHSVPAGFIRPIQGRGPPTLI